MHCTCSRAQHQAQHKKSKTLQTEFQWYIDVLRAEGGEAPKAIIYCR